MAPTLDADHAIEVRLEGSMQKRVLVLGGGFAGLESAIQLSKRAFEVSLVSARPYLFMYPTSIWIPTGAIRLEDVCLDLRAIAEKHGFRFVEGGVDSIDAGRRRVIVNGTTHDSDVLVLALGGARMQPKGVEHTHTLQGEADGALRLEEAFEALVARGAGRIAIGFGGNPADGSAVRGGPAFEVAFNFDTFLRRRGLRGRFELTFFAPMASPGARMGDRAVATIRRMFERLGIQSRFGKKIASFEPGGVVFEDGSRIESDLTVFIAAVAGHPVVKASDLPRNEAGFVRIGAGCEVLGFPGVYAVGDVAALEGPEWRAKQGHLAEVMARTAAFNIAAAEAGRPERQSYLDHLAIQCVLDTGNGAAYVYRDDHKQRMIPMPVVGHWLKKGWGTYFKASKRGRVPRLPGL